VPRARLDNHGCTTCHIEELSDFMNTCNSKAGVGKVLLLPRHHFHHHLILPQDSQCSQPLPDMRAVVNSSRGREVYGVRSSSTVQGATTARQRSVQENSANHTPLLAPEKSQDGVGLQARIPRSNVSSLIVVERLSRPRLTAPSSSPSS
jgi:hypothetical protein